MDDEPQEDDLVTEDHRRFFQYGKEVLRLVPDATEKEMWDSINKWMEKAGFYPSVWFISDHGNAHLMERPRTNTWFPPTPKKNNPAEKPKGAATIAARIQLAQDNLIEYIKDTIGVSRKHAVDIASAYVKHKLVKLDASSGQFLAKHGAVLGENSLRNAHANLHGKGAK